MTSFSLSTSPTLVAALLFIKTFGDPDVIELLSLSTSPNLVDALLLVKTLGDPDIKDFLYDIF